jgi:hypothetical protein
MYLNIVRFVGTKVVAASVIFRVAATRSSFFEISIQSMTKRSTKKSTRNQGTRIYSETFPPGYGDFVLKSSDGFIFHFPQFLLSHASPIFKDMCEICEDSLNDEEDPLTVTEDSTTVEALLLFIDPAKAAPPLHWSIAESFLEAADKYQIQGVPTWFDREVRAEAGRRHTEDYALKSPMTCLGLAIRYNLPEVSAYALRDLIRHPLQDIGSHPAVNARWMSYLFGLRAEKIKHLLDTAFELEAHAKAMFGQEPCDIHDRRSDFVWARSATKAIVTHPYWETLRSSFREAIHDSWEEGCTCLRTALPEGLERRMKLLENTVPDPPGDTYFDH